MLIALVVPRGEYLQQRQFLHEIVANNAEKLIFLAFCSMNLRRFNYVYCIPHDSEPAPPHIQLRTTAAMGGLVAWQVGSLFPTTQWKKQDKQLQSVSTVWGGLCFAHLTI